MNEHEFRQWQASYYNPYEKMHKSEGWRTVGYLFLALFGTMAAAGAIIGVQALFS